MLLTHSPSMYIKVGSGDGRYDSNPQPAQSLPHPARRFPNSASSGCRSVISLRLCACSVYTAGSTSDYIPFYNSSAHIITQKAINRLDAMYP